MLETWDSSDIWSERCLDEKTKRSIREFNIVMSGLLLVFFLSVGACCWILFLPVGICCSFLSCLLVSVVGFFSCLLVANVYYGDCGMQRLHSRRLVGASREGATAPMCTASLHTVFTLHTICTWSKYKASAKVFLLLHPQPWPLSSQSLPPSSIHSISADSVFQAVSGFEYKSFHGVKDFDFSLLATSKDLKGMFEGMCSYVSHTLLAQSF